MQRKGKSTPPRQGYAVKGAAPPPRKPSATQRMQVFLRRLVVGACVLAALVVGLYLVLQLPGREAARPSRLGCLPTDPIRAFGANLLYYNNGILTCVEGDGTIRWTFHLGTGAEFHASDSMVVAWNGNQLHVINASGIATYSNRMTETVQFARVGQSYVAAFLGEEDDGLIYVMDHQGAFLESIAVNNLLMMDVGFFGSKGTRMWTLGLDVQGISIATSLSTYEPGRLATGAVNLTDSLVYRIYNRDSYLMLVDTDEVAAYDYKCTPVSAIKSTLIYGWQFVQSREIGKECYTLLEPLPGDDGSRKMQSLRLLTKSADTLLRLPGVCVGAVLGSRGVYAFSGNQIYYARYGQNRFNAQQLSYAVEDVICVLEGDRAVVSSGLDVFLVSLPKL